MLAARCLGIAGAGKTTDALNVMEKVQRAGFSIWQIAFVTLTKAARREAAFRASELFGVSLQDLEHHGWFRTVHSCCYKILGLHGVKVVSDNRESKKWLQETLGGPVEVGNVGEDSWAEQFKGFSPPAIALRLWDLSRSLMCPYEDVYETCAERGGLPVREPLTFEDAVEYVTKYETAKTEDDRLDFTDMLLRFTGHQATILGCEKVDDGYPPPEVPVWVIDESQDNSLLMDLVIQRLVANATWVYLYGDIHQTIYSFCGASASHLMRWPVGDKERPLLKSWRCAREILDYGKRILTNCSRWGDHAWEHAQWEPRCEGGSITEHEGMDWDELVRPAENSLVMARTNKMAAQMGRDLTLAGVPWRYFKNNGGFARPNVLKIAHMMEDFNSIGIIKVEDFLTFLDEIPAGSQPRRDDYIKRGFKSGKQLKALPKGSVSFAEGLLGYGVQPLLIEKMKNGTWTELVEDADRVMGGIKRHGIDLVENPKVQVATIHGCKGAQADNVFVSTEIPYPVEKAVAEDGNAFDEECRLYYVAATRARDKLHLIGGRGATFQPAHDSL